MKYYLLRIYKISISLLYIRLLLTNYNTNNGVRKKLTYKKKIAQFIDLLILSCWAALTFLSIMHTRGDEDEKKTTVF